MPEVNQSVSPVPETVPPTSLRHRLFGPKGLLTSLTLSVGLAGCASLPGDKNSNVAHASGDQSQEPLNFCSQRTSDNHPLEYPFTEGEWKRDRELVNFFLDNLDDYASGLCTQLTDAYTFQEQLGAALGELNVMIDGSLAEIEAGSLSDAEEVSMASIVKELFRMKSTFSSESTSHDAHIDELNFALKTIERTMNHVSKLKAGYFSENAYYYHRPLRAYDFERARVHFREEVRSVERVFYYDMYERINKIKEDGSTLYSDEFRFIPYDDQHVYRVYDATRFKEKLDFHKKCGEMFGVHYSLLFDYNLNYNFLHSLDFPINDNGDVEFNDPDIIDHIVEHVLFSFQPGFIKVFVCSSKEEIAQEAQRLLRSEGVNCNTASNEASD